MKTRITAIATAAVFAFGTAASAAPLQLQTIFDVNLRPAGVYAPQGPDTPGLSGSTIKLTAIFADGTTFGSQFAQAESVVFDIMNASVASTNGMFTSTEGIGLFDSTSNGGLFKSTGFFPGLGFAISNLVNSVKLDAKGTIGARATGEALTLSILQGIQFDSTPPSVAVFSKSGSGGSNYIASNFRTSASDLGAIAPVPLPAGLPLLATALLGAGFVARRKRAA